VVNLQTMFTRQQAVSMAMGFLPMAPGYLASHYDDVTVGFAAGLCACAVLFGQGSFFGLVLYVVLWGLIAVAASRAAEKLLATITAKPQHQQQPSAPASRPATTAGRPSVQAQSPRASAAQDSPVEQLD
jgi:hypothetical protein